MRYLPELMEAATQFANFAAPMQRRLLFILLIFLLTHCTDDEKEPAFRQTLKTTKSPGGKPGIKLPSAYHPVIASSKQIMATENKTKKKRRTKKVIPENKFTEPFRTREQDSLITARLIRLRNSNIDLDLNEPLNKEFLSGTGTDTSFKSLITLNRESFFKINFDNDILDNTDQFYTNGIRFDLISPGLHLFPLSFLMVPYRKGGINYYGVSVTQNMYTPSTTKIGGILYGDRPYAAYLVFSNFRITNDVVRRIRQTSELMIGVIGPSSQGGFVQKAFHNSVPTNNEPLGWEYQIKDDFLVNYNFTLEKGLLSGRNLELNVSGSGALGTLYDNLSGGMLFRTGRINPYFSSLGLSRKFRNSQNRMKNVQAFFYAEAGGKLTGYDATLQGGVFNRSSVYTISSSGISRFMFNGTVGLAVVYGGIKLEVEQLVISPEFHNGWWHKWVHIGITFAL